MSDKKHLLILIFVFSIFCVFSAQADIREEKMEETLAAVNNENDDNPFGVLEFLHWNHAWNNYKYPSVKEITKAVKLMKEAGVGWVRVDFLWSDIEPQEGRFIFDKYDRIVETVTLADIKILGILQYSTDWASDCGKWNCPPRENNFFLRYVSKVIERYKGRVRYWELWNEPDSSIYWKNQDGLRSYCALLREVYLTAKKIDPNCKILNGGLANGIASVNNLYDHGGKGYFDILNIHIFETPLHKNAVKTVLATTATAYKIMSRNGDSDKKIWVTEIGCPGVNNREVAAWWMGENPTERQQAQFLKEVYTKLPEQKYIERVFWAFFRDCKNHWGNGVDYFGLVRWDFSKKPAFTAYERCYSVWKKTRTD
ncbi:MAG: glycosyl hydrolase [Candidatus Omnitrophica bacterium]|nr:glycosyl hydrolase [Candidatus Omnitrophota bacterium]